MKHRAPLFVFAFALLALPVKTMAAPAYEPVAYDRSDRTITLTGRDLTIDQVLDIAEHGAKVVLSREARQRSADAYGLLLQAAAEGVSVYWFNRGAGDQRETVIFSGDPTTPENTALLKARQVEMFKLGAMISYGPEIADESLVRAMMAIRVNTMSYEAASPALTQALIDLLNHRITPVVSSRGTLGEGDLGQLGDIGAALIGQGEVYYGGVRMPAADALRKAGLRPLEPFAADDSALTSTNAYALANSVLLVDDATKLLDWADLATAMALLGMNSSVTPLAQPVQAHRPFPWLNWDAARVLDMLRGSYLFSADDKRIIQDPESLRASTQRSGAAWQALAELRRSVLIGINSSDHNPAVRVGVKPTDSWELSTPQMMKYYVKGGTLSHGKSGYVFSNANWDPYPLANQVESFTLSLANLGIAVNQRIERFSNPFFTGIKPTDVLSAEQAQAMPWAGGYLHADLWIELSGLINPVIPQGQALIGTVEDLQSETRIKLERSRKAVDVMRHLLAQDVITSTNWIEIRKAQDSGRVFGAPAQAALSDLRRILPFRMVAGNGGKVAGQAVAEYLRTTPASRFYTSGPPMPLAPTGSSAP